MTPAPFPNPKKSIAPVPTLACATLETDGSTPLRFQCVTNAAFASPATPNKLNVTHATAAVQALRDDVSRANSM
jgi:CCR4-NOT transcriptional regulation complex NOT5 subunit